MTDRARKIMTALVASASAMLATGVLMPIHPTPVSAKPAEATVPTINESRAVSEDAKVAVDDDGYFDEVARQITKMWRIAPEVSKTFVHSAREAARLENVDPLIILSVAATETGFQHVGNPGSLGLLSKDGRIPEHLDDPKKPWGAMQVSGAAHKDKFPGGVVRKTSLSENIKLGTKVLGEYLRLEKGDITRALQRYNGSIRDETNRYAKKVLKNYTLMVKMTDHAIQLATNLPRSPSVVLAETGGSFRMIGLGNVLNVTAPRIKERKLSV